MRPPLVCTGPGGDFVTRYHARGGALVAVDGTVAGLIASLKVTVNVSTVASIRPFLFVTAAVTAAGYVFVMRPSRGNLQLPDAITLDQRDLPKAQIGRAHV